MKHFEESEHGPALTGPAPDQTATLEEVDALATSKRTTPPAFQFYASDFLSSDKVSRMSLAEVGVYITLLCHAWLAHGLPNDHSQIARYVRLPTARLKRLWAGPLGECFVLKGGRLVNPRQERIRVELLAFIAKQKANGKLGGRPRKPTGNPGHNPNDNPDETQTLATANPNKSSSVFSLQSSSTPTKNVGVARARQAPIHDTSHRKHAFCGRVCLPVPLFDEFVRRRNSLNADAEILDWATAVDAVWSDGGQFADTEPGSPYDFWKARYAEKWPVAVASAQGARVNTQMSPAVAARIRAAQDAS